MNKEKKLLKNFFIYFLGTFCSKILIFLLLPLYTNYLTVKEYGEYDLLLTLIILVEGILSLRIPDAIYRWLLDSHYLKKEIINTGIYFLKKIIILFTILYSIIFLVFKFNNFLLIYLYLITNLSLILAQNIIRGLKKNKLFSVFGILETLIFLILNILLIVYFNLKIEGIIISKICSNFLWSIYLLKYMDQRRNNELSKKILKDMLKYSVPLIPSALSWWIIKVSDRYCINYFLGFNANGIYAVANKFPSILLILNNMFYLAWQESSISNYEKKDRDIFYNSVFEKLMIFQFSICILLIPSIKICSSLLGKDFQKAWIYSIPLIVGTIFSGFSAFYATAYLSSRNTFNTFKSSLMGAIVNVSLNIIFMKKYGLQVAGISTLISFILMWVYRIEDTKKYFLIKINWNLFLYLLFQLALVSIITVRYNSKIQIYNLIINFIIIIYLNKEIVKLILKKVKMYE